MSEEHCTIENDPHRLTALVAKAFAAIESPGTKLRDMIARWYTGHEDAIEVWEAVRGRHWSTITAKETEYFREAIAFMTP